MWPELHPYLAIYLLGCGLAAFLIIFKMILFWFVAWITKENILNKNIKKIQEPDEKSIALKVTIFLGVFVFETALSWINAVFAIWQIFAMLFRVLREALTTVPEEIKLLRFPLRNNPHMSREAVWAYAFALGVKGGNDMPDEEIIRYSLDDLCVYYSDFDRKAALKQLSDFKVISDEVIEAVRNYEDSAEDDFSWDDDLYETDKI